MKTVERILKASLQLLNAEGAARVSTNSIADVADLSVGNLYYHFKNKDDILIALFDEFQLAVKPLLDLDTTHRSLEQWVQWWQQWFNAVQLYGFIFHDQKFLKNQSVSIEHRYHILVSQVENTQLLIFKGLKDHGQLIATNDDLNRMAKEVTFIAFFWQDFYEIRRTTRELNRSSFESALQQTLGLLLPYMAASEQLKVEQLINATKPK